MALRYVARYTREYKLRMLNECHATLAGPPRSPMVLVTTRPLPLYESERRLAKLERAKGTTNEGRTSPCPEVSAAALLATASSEQMSARQLYRTFIQEDRRACGVRRQARMELVQKEANPWAWPCCPSTSSRPPSR